MPSLQSRSIRLAPNAGLIIHRSTQPAEVIRGRWSSASVFSPKRRTGSGTTGGGNRDIGSARLDDFERVIDLSATEREALQRGGTMLPVGVTPYYMSLLDPDDPQQPLRKTVVPTTAEFGAWPGEADDPLGEDGHSPVPGLVHRYPDRVLLLPLDFCSTYCRYCTRSRVVGHGEIVPNEARLEAIFDYLEQATQVRDVLISGGDPLALSDDRLDAILRRLRSIPHIEFVRIGTKMPAVLPQRITAGLVRRTARISSAVDESSLPASRRVHAGIGPGLRAFGRRRDPAWVRKRCCSRESTTTSRR